MTARGLRIALGVSVALNLFALVTGATVLVAQNRVEDGIAAERRPNRDRPPMLTGVEGLDPEVRERVRETLRASALAARPDFEEARRKRREAVALGQSDAFDPARARRLLDESRAAELRGRARLESDAVGLLEMLEPRDRAAVAQILTRRGRFAARGPHDPASAPAKP